MNNIIKAFEQNSLPNDMVFDTYGISADEHFDCIFVAPSWAPNKVFDIDNITIEQIFDGRFAKSFRIRNQNKNYLYVMLQVGAPNIVDFCLLGYKIKCENFVFIGSVGALVPEIKVGDVIIPGYAISGNGATLYLHDNLDSKNLFEHTYSTKAFNQKIMNVCHDKGLNPVDVPVVSIDSLMSEYLHLDEFKAIGAKALEMEVATFFASMSLVNKNASAMLVVSDNSATGEHLIGRTDADKVYYNIVRKQIGEILLNI